VRPASGWRTQDPASWPQKRGLASFRTISSRRQRGSDSIAWWWGIVPGEIGFVLHSRVPDPAAPPWPKPDCAKRSQFRKARPRPRGQLFETKPISRAWRLVNDPESESCERKHEFLLYQCGCRGPLSQKAGRQDIVPLLFGTRMRTCRGHLVRGNARPRWPRQARAGRPRHDEERFIHVLRDPGPACDRALGPWRSLRVAGWPQMHRS
jgi:hypothetical protein